MKASEKLSSIIQERQRTLPFGSALLITPGESYALKALRGYESAHAAIHQEQKEAYQATIKKPTRGSRFWDNEPTFWQALKDWLKELRKG